MGSPVISDAYRIEQQRLHETTNYGTASIGFAPLVSNVCDKLEVRHLLDYGCGSQTNLLKHLKVNHPLKYQAYDPGVPKYSGRPAPAELVTCIDVLEHVEPEFLDNVLDDLEALTEAVAFITIHTGPASKTLSDGRNAHINQQPIEWWLPRLICRFELQSVEKVAECSYYFIGYARVHLETVNGDKLT